MTDEQYQAFAIQKLNDARPSWMDMKDPIRLSSTEAQTLPRRQSLTANVPQPIASTASPGDSSGDAATGEEITAAMAVIDGATVEVHSVTVRGVLGDVL